MILLIDNYDSFVHNLARYVGELGYARRIVRNDGMSVDEIRALKPQAVILSPGPCGPDQAGISLELVRRLGPDIPILGVCLGHQVIAQAFGGTVRRAGQAHQMRRGMTRLAVHRQQGFKNTVPQQKAAVLRRDAGILDSTENPVQPALHAVPPV